MIDEKRWIYIFGKVKKIKEEISKIKKITCEKYDLLEICEKEKDVTKKLEMRQYIEFIEKDLDFSKKYVALLDQQIERELKLGSKLILIDETIEEDDDIDKIIEYFKKITYENASNYKKEVKEEPSFFKRLFGG